MAEKKFLPTFHIYLPLDLSKEAYIHWTDNHGKRHHKKGGVNRLHSLDERRVALEVLRAELVCQFEAALLVSPVAEQLVAWVDENRGKWRRKTYQTYKSKIDCLVRWGKGREITNQLLRTFFNELAGGKHKATHLAYLVTLQRALKGIGKLELLDGIERLRGDSTPAKYFQQSQIQRIKRRLLECDPALWLACQFIYFCFIRPGELRLLRVGDVDFDNWKICLRAEISKNKKQQFVTVPVAFRTAVGALAERAPREYVFFKNDCTKPLPVNGLLNRFRKVLTDLGFGSEYKLYSWKHTGAVACVRSGTNLKELQIQLRHHSLEEVERYIRQLGVNDLQDLEAKFPAI